LCLVGWAYGHFADAELVIAANRDEFQARPTQAMHLWQDKSGVLAGRDLEAGGTWLAVDQRGRMAAVTNFREGHRSSAPKSRGDLVLDFVCGAESAADFAQEISQYKQQYGGFNLLLFDGNSLWYSSNRGPNPRPLGRGVGSLSNGDLEKRWPKMSALERAMLDTKPEQVDQTRLLHALQDKAKPDESELPDTGVSKEWEKFLSSVFIVGDAYGTRCSSLISISREQIYFREISYTRSGEIEMEQTESLKRIKG